jgi:hypothetical protein
MSDWRVIVGTFSIFILCFSVNYLNTLHKQPDPVQRTQILHTFGVGHEVPDKVVVVGLKSALCNTNNTDSHKTVCCPLLVNPVSGELVCDCAEIEQPNPRDGFTITSACLERDIDECSTNNGDCHPDAICTNYNVVNIPKSVYIPPTHMCECRPGLTGDGITNCVAK